MRILGVVTLVSPDGEYGGPLRVAVNQLTALRDLGHEVTLAGAHRGFSGTVPREVDGIPARLHPARRLVPGTGFAGLGAPGLWRALRRHARDFDVVHVHVARDLVTLPAARIVQAAGVPTVLQPHGMIVESRNPLAAPLDAAMTRRVLDAAKHVCYLTPEERSSLEVVSRGRAQLTELANGVPAAEQAVHAGQHPAHVLYLARLASRKRPGVFVDAASRLASQFPDAHFTLVGPDEGEGDAVRSAIAASDAPDRLRWVGPVSPAETAQQLASASIYALPSVDEPYPMAVLEAMAAGLPTVVTDSCGLAPFIAAHDAGVVADETPAGFRSALHTLLSDPSEARAKGERGRDAVREHRSMAAIAERLESLYR